MKTIVEPKENIFNLWGKQNIHETEKYRLMHYVLRMEHDNKVLLHNVVTGQLVVLEQNEAEMLQKLPTDYNSVMEQLVRSHFLVPDNYDEHGQIVKLKTILLKLYGVHKEKAISCYTILPTTACNARCYYCFEHGTKFETMTKQTADELIEFIANNAGENKKVFLIWFGGEPTLAVNRIDQICEGLIKRDIKYSSRMITNGYLFDEAMVAKAKELWNLKRLQICVDGTELSYNKIKAYVGVKDNPYQRVMRNIGLLLNSGIPVILRMNYDLGNYQEFPELLKEAKERFGDHELLHINAHPVIGEYEDCDGNLLHGSADWFMDTFHELNDAARNNGVNRKLLTLPYMNMEMCSAYDDSAVVITPSGSIVKCPERFNEDEVIGKIQSGISNVEIVESWKELANYPQCKECVLFPKCVKLARCGSGTDCHKYNDCLAQYNIRAQMIYEAHHANHSLKGAN